MYKIILWIGDDLEKGLKTFKDYDQDKILIIGDGKRILSTNDLFLTPDQKAKIDGNTQLVFFNHGGIVYGTPSSVSYQLNQENTPTFLGADIVLSKILSNAKDIDGLDNGILCHMVSCYSGLTAGIIQTNPNLEVIDNIPAKSTI